MNTQISNSKKLPFYALFAVLCMALLAPLTAQAAGTTGTELQAAFNVLSGMAGGYGKQILITIGFVVAAVSIMAAQATGALIKFIGFAVFLGTALTAALTVSGAMI